MNAPIRDPVSNLGGTGLQAHVRSDERGIDLTVEIAPGETVAVMGPNGAGKSTLLSCIAGVLQPDHADIRLDGTVLADSSTRRWVPPHRRGTALLSQDPLLFPHLDAGENVAFGPRSAGTPRAAARQLAHRWLSDVGVGELAHRRPAELSGGQAQRVALARALAGNPDLLLLDEPMAALDVSVAPELRRLLRDVLAERTTLLITHDVLDALALADRVMIVQDGRVAESGPTSEVLSRPRSSFGARVAGLDLLRGFMRHGSVVTKDGHTVAGLTDEAIEDGASAVAVFSPSSVSVHLGPPGGSPRNVLRSVVTHVETQGERVRVRTEVADAEVTLAAATELDLVPGRTVHLVVKATEVRLHPA
ncbi:sulfate/molybdate ABC transporter ATP-binding protein [Aeromicrobium sp. CTD01-1L150]|uniref:sulfate/molybdate ABC transporter ATP-binding protein n=1 Tax=Aeromicrobium sp. CTD01-1L150 TaxID=3341830 RepID=UPI0035C15F4C